jgi:hypothetical protein
MHLNPAINAKLPEKETEQLDGRKVKDEEGERKSGDRDTGKVGLSVDETPARSQKIPSQVPSLECMSSIGGGLCCAFCA